MTETEKQFFEAFGIKAYYKYLLIDKTTKWHNEKLLDKTNFINFVKTRKDYLLLKVIKYYPQITDRILLELICILNKEIITISKVQGDSLEKVKANILEKCIRNCEFYSTTSLQTYNKLANNFKHQVQALFKEDN